jgi:hypothetical protein
MFVVSIWHPYTSLSFFQVDNQTPVVPEVQAAVDEQAIVPEVQAAVDEQAAVQEVIRNLMSK